MSQTTPKDSAVLTATIYQKPSEGDISQISPSGESRDISSLITDFKYYETIYSGFVTAKVTLLDSTGLLADNTEFNNGCGLTKFCAIEIILIDPTSGTGYQRSISRVEFTGANCFYVNRIVNQIQQGKKRVYQLELVNRAGLIAASKRILQSWPDNGGTNIEYNQIIEDMLTQNFNVPASKLDVTSDVTEPTSKYQAHYYHPTKIINDLCRLAVPRVQSGGGAAGPSSSTTSGGVQTETLTKHAGYAFFETSRLFKYVSLDSLISVNGAVSFDATHVFATTIVNDSETTDEQKSQTIISYQFYEDEQTSGVIEDVVTGKTGTKSKIRYDNTTKRYIRSDPTVVKDPCESIASEGSIVSVEYTNTTTYDVEYYDTCDENALDTAPINSHITSLNYDAIMEDLRSRTSKIRVPGNLSVSVGDKVSLFFQKLEGKGEQQEEFSDKYSGIYIVTGLLHKVEGVNKFFTHLQVCRIRGR